AVREGLLAGDRRPQRRRYARAHPLKLVEKKTGLATGRDRVAKLIVLRLRVGHDDGAAEHALHRVRVAPTADIEMPVSRCRLAVIDQHRRGTPRRCQLEMK